MKAPTLVAVAFALLLLASIGCAQNLTRDEIRQEALQRIQAANGTLPLTKGAGGKHLLSYREINPYTIADLLTAHVMIYVDILYNYPSFTAYDMGDLRLLDAQYVPQRFEFNYVKRV